MTALVKRKHPKPQLAPGHVVINISGASGGVSYTREVVAQRSRRAAVSTTFTNVMHVDHKAFVTEINSLVKKVDDTILRNMCVKMGTWHFVAEANVSALRSAVATLRSDVEALNLAAAVAGSAHRGRVGVVLAALDVTQPDVVGECCRTIAEILSELRDALRLGDVDDVVEGGKVIRRNAMKPLLIRAKNLTSLVTGDAHDALVAALDRVRTARAEVRQVTDTRRVDLSAITAALAWFA